MKLVYLTLSNFRQYVGTHTIHFAGSGDKEKNITLIRGANGYGKTGIFRAIMFCLYGVKSLDQDSLSGAAAKKGLLLVNEKLLGEALGGTVNAFVEMCFEHEENVYVLKREIRGSRRADEEAVQEDVSTSLVRKVPAGDTKPAIKDSEKIREDIERILPYKLKDFFLFDGERIDNLTRPGDTQKKEIQRGIKTLLHLDSLTSAIEALKKQEDKLRKQVQENSTSEVSVIAKKATLLSTECRTLEAELLELESNLDEAKSQLIEIENKFDQNKAVIEIQKKRKEVSNAIAREEEVCAEHSRNLTRLVSTFTPSLARGAISELSDDLRSRLDRGELPSDVKEEFIDGLLESGLCICGTHLVDGTEQHNKIADYKKRKITPGQDELVGLCADLRQLQEFARNQDSEFQLQMGQITSVRDEISKLNKDLAKLDALRGDSPDIDIQNLDSARKNLERNRDQFSKSIGEKEHSLKLKRQDLVKLDAKTKELNERDAIGREFQRRLDAIVTSVAALQDVGKRYTVAMRDELSRVATNAFKAMASPETLRSLTSIAITNDFHLEVISGLGRPMLAQISSGQRQIVSLAYICALIESLGSLEMPLLMDTPLGRLSGTHRDGCIKFIPTQTSQWVMLVTDTEMQEQEAEELRRSGKLGRIYEILPHGLFESEIVEQRLENWVPVRSTANREVAV